MSVVAPTAPATETGDAPAQARVRPLRILVVDDNHDAADSLANLLIELGHSVKRCYDGRIALLLASQFQPDLVFLDIVMPRMDGFELSRALRDLPGLADVTIIAITGYGDDELRDLTRVAGFSGHLVKPATIDGLTPVLRFTAGNA
jgi:CheY-like chemotaxis protein